jgi:hypothetical protein
VSLESLEGVGGEPEREPQPSPGAATSGIADGAAGEVETLPGSLDKTGLGAGEEIAGQ